MIALIPARGGSKGLPGKNIRELNGKPLIAYAIDAAKEAKCIDRVVITTDDEKIADVAKKYGAEVPFLRPAELATDTAGAIDVYLHAIDFLSNEAGGKIDIFMVLLPTAPFRTAKHIDEAYRLFVEKKCTSLVSVTKAETPPSWYFYRNSEGKINNCKFGIDSSFVSNRQEDDDYVIPNGAIYILDYDLLKNKRTYYAEDTVGYLMSRRESVDIDTMDDLLYADFLMHYKE